MCTALKGTKGMAKDSWFLPFNQGWNDGAGNPPNPDGIKTDYLWKRILTPGGPDGDSGELRADRGGGEPEDRQEEAGADFPALPPARRGAETPGRCAWHGAGKRYLIQHSAGSGKSNSIAWLAHQLISVRKDGEGGLRLDHRHHRPAHSRQTNPRDDQGLCPGGQHHRRGEGRRGRLQDRAALEVPQGREEDHHLHGADLSLRARQHRRGTSRREVRHHH